MRLKVKFCLPFILITVFISGIWPNAGWCGAKIISAKIEGERRIEVRFEGNLTEDEANLYVLEPFLAISDRKIVENRLILRTAERIPLDRHFYLNGGGNAARFVEPDGVLDSLYSTKPLGLVREGKRQMFRLFAPRARWVRLVMFDDFRAKKGREYKMRRDEDGVWEFESPADWTSQFYGYRVWGPQGEGEAFDSTVVIGDPYSEAVVSENNYHHPAKTLIMPPDTFDWRSAKNIKIAWQDLIIYEMHIRDMTADASSGLPAKLRGTYSGLISPNQRGGLPYIKQLGVNAVELQPAQEFANIELPFRDPSTPQFNTWNPYSRNHWGYMTSYFFAPESYYATGGTMQPGRFNGADGRQVREFKAMVRAFHRHKIAVLMDVVYNHVSNFDYNPLKYIDKFYYFRLNPDHSYRSESGTGNDLKTERPMARRLILDSIRHWMNDYGIDGFRFDLANLIDPGTRQAIIRTAKQINPAVILIAEPWGGGYNPAGMSREGFASWNDQFRNGVKGQNPHNGLGFIFGKWQDGNNRRSLRRYIMGSLVRFGGQYQRASHSVNYLESHDDNTLGDFIRMGLGMVDESRPAPHPEALNRISAQELKLNKLAALFLFTSRGIAMLHEGQEYARSKIIAKTDAPDPRQGYIDHNSYEKDNQTNWLDFDTAAQNKNLRDYYAGLIALRKKISIFRKAEPEQYHFKDSDDSLLIDYTVGRNRGGERFRVILNGNPKKTYYVKLGGKETFLLANGRRVYPRPFELKQSSYAVPPTSGLILMIK